MFKTVKDLKNIQFPLYAIPSDNWDVLDGIVFVDGAFVDDLNKSGSSIGIRRKQAKRPEEETLKLKAPLFYPSDVIKSKKKHFISSGGVPFTYVKTGFQKIKYHRIRKFESRGTFTFVWLSGVSIPLYIPRPPTDSGAISWTRVLYYGDFPWMIYDFSQYQGRDTRIKV